MKAADIMTRKVKSATPATPVRDVAKTMITKQISGVPVVDRGRRVLGIITEGDLLRRTELGTERKRSWWLEFLVDSEERAQEFVRSHGLKAADVMTRSVISVTPRTELAEVVDLMERWKIKRVPVVSNGKLVGIVSRHDLMRTLSRAKPKTKRIKGGDAAIRDYLRRETERESWTDPATVNFVVEKGTVELFGAVRSPAQRDALRIMAESAPGVRAVKNRLSVLPALLQAT